MEIRGSNPRHGELSFELIVKCQSGTLRYREKIAKTWNQGPNGRSLIPGMLRSFLQRDFTFGDFTFRDFTVRSWTLRSGTLRSWTLRSWTLHSGTQRTEALRAGTLKCQAKCSRTLRWGTLSSCTCFLLDSLNNIGYTMCNLIK